MSKPPGYLLPPSTASHLLKSLPIPNDNGVKLLGHSVLITPRPANPQVLSRVGGLGNKVDFDVIGWGHWENRVWAAIVKPANPDMEIYTGMSYVPVLVCDIAEINSIPPRNQPADNCPCHPWARDQTYGCPQNQELAISARRADHAHHHSRWRKVVASDRGEQPRRRVENRLSSPTKKNG